MAFAWLMPPHPLSALSLWWKAAELVVFVEWDGSVVAVFLLICIFIEIEVTRGSTLFLRGFLRRPRWC